MPNRCQCECEIGCLKKDIPEIKKILWVTEERTVMIWSPDENGIIPEQDYCEYDTYYGVTVNDFEISSTIKFWFDARWSPPQERFHWIGDQLVKEWIKERSFCCDYEEMGMNFQGSIRMEENEWYEKGYSYNDYEEEYTGCCEYCEYKCENTNCYRDWYIKSNWVWIECNTWICEDCLQDKEFSEETPTPVVKMLD